MRRAMASVAVLGLALMGAPYAQGQDRSGASATLATTDMGFYGAIARQRAAGAPDDTDIAWSSAGRTGTIRFSSSSAGCKDFFLRELTPERRTPVVGRVCPVQGAAQSTTPVYTTSNVRYAAAAGPGGEPRTGTGEGPGAGGVVLTPPPRREHPGATRGIGARPPAPPPPMPPAVVAPPPAPAPPDGYGGSSGGIAREIPVAGRLVNLTRLQDRIDRAGGHAVVLFRNLPATQARNRAACQALLLNFQETTYANTVVGVEKEADGTVVAIRPIFWPTNPSVAAGTGDRCAQKMRQYDYGRAAAILDKLDRPSAGPFLVVSRDDQRQAAIIEMTGLTTAQIPNMVVYFRDRFSQQRDIWSPSVNTPAARRPGLVLAFGQSFTQNLVSAISLFSASSARVASGCIGDTRDTRSCGPH